MSQQEQTLNKSQIVKNSSIKVFVQFFYSINVPLHGFDFKNSLELKQHSSSNHMKLTI